jgi:hypothetical protein
MWATHVLPRLAARGVGANTEVRTLRLHGIGESQVAELLGEALLRATNPVVATYARAEAVDVRISARDAIDTSAAELADEAEGEVTAVLGDHVWARGTTSWAQAIDEALAARSWSLATTERGTDGALVGLLRAVAGRRFAEVDGGEPAEDDPRTRAQDRDRVAGAASRVREATGADVGCALEAISRGSDLRAVVGIATPAGTSVEERLVFQRGGLGADRAAIAAAALLLAEVRQVPSGAPSAGGRAGPERRSNRGPRGSARRR